MPCGRIVNLKEKLHEASIAWHSRAEMDFYGLCMGSDIMISRSWSVPAIISGSSLDDVWVTAQETLNTPKSTARKYCALETRRCGYLRLTQGPPREATILAEAACPQGATSEGCVSVQGLVRVLRAAIRRCERP